jgi:hypothetical protein
MADPNDPYLFHDDESNTKFKLLVFFCILRAFIFLESDKSPAAVLAFAQITFVFFITNPARNIKPHLKSGPITAMRTKFSWHASTPFSIQMLNGIAPSVQ